MSNKDSSNLKDSNGLVGWLSGQKHLPCEPEDLSPCLEPMVEGKNRLPKLVLWPPCVYSGTRTSSCQCINHTCACN